MHRLSVFVFSRTKSLKADESVYSRLALDDQNHSNILSQAMYNKSGI